MSFPVPPGVGGRYSVLSSVGLLLAEVIGIDSDDLLKGAKDIEKRCSYPDLVKNPAYLFGTLLCLMVREKQRTIDVMVPYADSLKPLSEWFCQLWAESLGKDNTGLTPYPSLGTTDQHSQLQLCIQGPEDKAITFIRVNDHGTDFKIPGVRLSLFPETPRHQLHPREISGKMPLTIRLAPRQGCQTLAGS